MVRDGEGLREASWSEAFTRCEELIRGVRETHGAEAMGVYVGNPTAHNLSLSRYVGALIGISSRWYSPGTIDTWPRNVASLLMYGNAWRIPVPDVERTDLFLCMGANPQASNGSLFSCTDILGEIDRIRERGGRTIVVDPRRTGTADRADQWIPIRPGADAAFLLGVLHVLFAEDLVDLGSLALKVENLDVVESLCAGWAPERTQPFTGVPAEVVRDLARQLAAAPAAAVYSRIGLCNQEFGTLASWLTDVVAICTGNLDRVGGAMFPVPFSTVTALLPSTRRDGPAEFGRWKSHARGIPEVLDQIPVGLLHEEITTPGEGQLRGLIVVAGNPVVSAPEGDRLDAALPQLECMISLDNYVNETSRHADVILPGASALEQGHCDSLYHAYSVRTAARWSDPVASRPEGMPPDWETVLTLQGLLLGIPLADLDVKVLDDGFFSAMAGLMGADPQLAIETRPTPGPERLVDLEIRTGPFGDRYGEVADGWTLDRLKEHPHGIDLGPMVTQAAEVVATPSGLIDLAPDYIVADLPRLEAKLDDEVPELVLVSRRHLRSNNSWMHNIRVLVKGRDRCTLLIHPDDAIRCQLTDGATAQVTSRAGSLEVPVEITDSVMAGVVSLPHGWGHDRPGSRLSVAEERPGVNSNVLLPADFLDVPSGNVAVNGVPVRVVPAPSNRG